LRLTGPRGTPTPRPSARASSGTPCSVRASRCLGGVRAVGTAAACGQAFLARHTCVRGTPAALTAAARRTPHPAQAPRAVVRSNRVLAAARLAKRHCAAEWRRSLPSAEAGSVLRDYSELQVPSPPGDRSAPQGAGEPTAAITACGASAVLWCAPRSAAQAAGVAIRTCGGPVNPQPQGCAVGAARSSFGSRSPARIDIERRTPDAEPSGVGVRRSAVGAQAARSRKHGSTDSRIHGTQSTDPRNKNSPEFRDTNSVK
jgi:hypothetical protein